VSDVAEDCLRILLGAVERALNEIANECTERMFRLPRRQPTDANRAFVFTNYTF